MRRTSGGRRSGWSRRLAFGRARGAVTLAVVAVLAGWPASVQAQARLSGALSPDGDDFVITLGPIELPAGATHHQVDQPEAQEVRVPGGGWLRGYRIELVDAAGKRVPQAVLHHLNLIMPDRRDLFAPIMMRIGAAGHETAPVELPRLMGFRVHPGEGILVTAMFSNEDSRQAYHGVRMRVHMPFTAAGTWLPPFSVEPFYIDVMPPAGTHAYDLPAGKSQRSWDAHPAAAARLLGMGGHLHRYGTLLRFEDVTAHKMLWEAHPRVAADGEVTGMPTGRFWWRGGLKVLPSHTYRLTAFYHNPTGKAIPDGAMGTLGGVLVLSRGGVWPAVNRADPEYRKDVESTYAGMHMPKMNMGMQPMSMTPAAPAPPGAPARAVAPAPAATPAPAAVPARHARTRATRTGGND
jgi:hypothetical protein